MVYTINLSSYLSCEFACDNLLDHVDEKLFGAFKLRCQCLHIVLHHVITLLFHNLMYLMIIYLNKSIFEFWYNLVTMNWLIIPKTFIVLIWLIMNVCIYIQISAMMKYWLPIVLTCVIIPKTFIVWTIHMPFSIDWLLWNVIFVSWKDSKQCYIGESKHKFE